MIESSIRLLILTSVFVLSESLHTVIASEKGLQDVPEEVLISQLSKDFDGMKFKDLRNFAATNKKNHSLVVTYFNNRAQRLVNTKCPNLTSDWFTKNISQKFNSGYPDFYAPSRVRDFLKTPWIVTIDNITWGISIVKGSYLAKKMGETITNEFFNNLDTSKLPYQIEVVETISRRLMDPFLEEGIQRGPIIDKKCFYTIDFDPAKNDVKERYVSIVLKLGDEFLNLKGLNLDSVINPSS